MIKENGVGGTAMKLVRLIGNTGYIETETAALPVYWLSENRIILVDSGTEPDEALFELLDAHGLKVRAVACTHLHMDHTANNRGLVERHGAEVFAHPQEILRLQAREHVPYPISAIPEGTELEIDGVRFRLLHTPGHTAGHLIYITPDRVCCTGDAIMTQDMLDRAKIPYMDDVDRSIISMEDIRELNCPYYIAAHRGVAAREEIAALVECNIQKELDLYDLLRSRITGPVDLEELTDDFIQATGVRSLKAFLRDYIRHTVQVRIFALVYAGEFDRIGDMIVPHRF